MRVRVLALVALASAITTVVALSLKAGRADSSLAARLKTMVPAPTAQLSCQQQAGPAPLVLLVLGQSNAGNHGAEDESPAAGDGPVVTVFAGKGCVHVPDPLPGATGRHRSIWAQVPRHLQRLGVQREVVIALLAVDSTTIDDWTRAGSPLQLRLRGLLEALREAGLQPARVLWQQGESDAREGTQQAEYSRAFEVLLASLRSGGVAAPVLLAKSTVCGAGDASGVRAAINGLVQRHSDLLEGPDTDRLQGGHRPTGCHYSRTGVEEAAAMWAEALVRSGI